MTTTTMTVEEIRYTLSRYQKNWDAALAETADAFKNPMYFIEWKATAVVRAQEAIVVLGYLSNATDEQLPDELNKVLDRLERQFAGSFRVTDGSTSASHRLVEGAKMEAHADILKTFGRWPN